MKKHWCKNKSYNYWKIPENTNARITNIDTIKDFVEEVGLFEDHKIFLVNSAKELMKKPRKY